LKFIEDKWWLLLKVFISDLHQFIVILIVVFIGLHLRHCELFLRYLRCELGLNGGFHIYFFLSATLLWGGRSNNNLDLRRLWLYHYFRLFCNIFRYFLLHLFEVSLQCLRILVNKLFVKVSLPQRKLLFLWSCLFLVMNRLLDLEIVFFLYFFDSVSLGSTPLFGNFGNIGFGLKSNAECSCLFSHFFLAFQCL
jgi:hypothetical protein